MSPPPQYIEGRLSIYNKLKAEHDALLAEKAAKDSKPIKIMLPDGKLIDGESWKTTPYQVACGIRLVTKLNVNEASIFSPNVVNLFETMTQLAMALVNDLLT